MSTINLLNGMSPVSSNYATGSNSIAQNYSNENNENRILVLQEDTVTLSKDNCQCNDGQNSQHQYSSNRSKARMAYLGIAKKVSDPTVKTDSNEDKTNVSDGTVNTDESKDNEKGSVSEEKGANGKTLSDKEKQQLQELKSRDIEVKKHEQTHQRVGSPYTSAPSYEYETGPDGKKYAVAGSVNIDSSDADTPEKTAEKMRIIIKAAKAPAQPSSKDLSVAADASRRLNEANAKVQKEKQEQMKENMESANNKDSVNEDPAKKENENKNIQDMTEGSSSIAPQKFSESKGF